MRRPGSGIRNTAEPTSNKSRLASRSPATVECRCSDRAHHGGAREIAQVTGAMEALRKLAGLRTFLMVGDSKLISYDNVHALIKAGV